MTVPNVANINTATTEDIKWLTQHTCKHGHKYISHFSCYCKENHIDEHKGCFDLEAGELNANTDIMFSWAIKTVDKDEIWYDHVTPEELRSGEYDKRIVETAIDKIKSYDRLITHFGCGFDIPFLRSRALSHGLEFPAYGTIWHTDVWKICKRCLKLTSNRQQAVGEFLQGESIKTRVDFGKWMAVKYGSNGERKKALKYIIDHNIKDVIELEQNYLSLLPYCKETRSSI